MTETATHARITGEENSAAVFADGWLPDVDVFPELTELRQEHERIREQHKAESANVRAVEARVAAARAQREAAMTEAYLAGTPVDKVDAEGETLRAELEQAKERARAALTAYIEHINIAVATIVQRRPQWLEQIESVEAGTHAEIAQLSQQLVEKERTCGAFFKLAYWIDRTGTDAAESPYAHIAFKTIPPKASKDPDEVARESQRLMEESYAGGLGADPRMSDDESAEREDEHMVPAQLPDQEVARINAQMSGPGVLTP